MLHSTVFCFVLFYVSCSVYYQFSLYVFVPDKSILEYLGVLFSTFTLLKNFVMRISGSIMLFHCGLFGLFVIYTLHAHGVSVSAHVCALHARNFLLHLTCV